MGRNFGLSYSGKCGARSTVASFTGYFHQRTVIPFKRKTSLYGSTNWGINLGKCTFLFSTFLIIFILTFTTTSFVILFLHSASPFPKRENFSPKGRVFSQKWIDFPKNESFFPKIKAIFPERANFLPKRKRHSPKCLVLFLKISYVAKLHSHFLLQKKIENCIFQKRWALSQKSLLEKTLCSFTHSIIHFFALSIIQ